MAGRRAEFSVREPAAAAIREEWRRELPARDESGGVGRAAAAAQRALERAASPAERYQAARWRVLIECLGD